MTADGRDTVRQVMLPVWSSYYFFTLYANAANNGAGFDARTLRADEAARTAGNGPLSAGTYPPTD
ncbi:MAG: hypothetical protein ACLSUZ_07135 [Bifidobacterium pseudocatenulatum]